MAKDPVGRKISKLRSEGKKQSQAVAIALDMERRGDLPKHPGKKKPQNSPSKHPEKAVTPMAYTRRHEEATPKRMTRPPYDKKSSR